jgi:very-short-patch-repair endonuclease
MTKSGSTISPSRRDTAKRLRANTTTAEDLLWQKLRRFPMTGSHFRRQVPIGPYVADFACMAARLIIEVDGSHHGDDDNRRRDDVWTRWLEAAGYRILRFWNNDLTANMDGVLEAIYAAVYGSSSAAPAPLKHERRRRVTAETTDTEIKHGPTPARFARVPSPYRGGERKAKP